MFFSYTHIIRDYIKNGVKRSFRRVQILKAVETVFGNWWISFHQ